MIRFELSNIFSKLLTDVLYLRHYHFTGISLENLVLQNRGSVSTDFPKDSDSSTFWNHLFSTNLTEPYHQQIQTLPLRFYGLINVLESFAGDKFRPHLFTPSLNLFTEISSHNLRVLCQEIQFLEDAQSLRVEENTWLEQNCHRKIIVKKTGLTNQPWKCNIQHIVLAW